MTDPPMTGYNPGKPCGGICMKGSVGYDKGVRRYYIAWYDEASKRTIKLWYYRGDKSLPFLKGKQGKKLSETMLAQMRGDYENKVFRLEKYMQRASDVVPYLRKWLETIEPTIAPGTYHDYKGSIENHLVPFSPKDACSSTRSSSMCSQNFNPA